MRERIIQKAQELFLQYGTARITMDELASQLGISKKTLYSFFASKEALLACVSELGLQESQQTLDRIIAQHANPARQLAALLAFLQHPLLRYSAAFMDDIHRRYGEEWNHYQDFMHHRLYPLLTQVLQAGSKMGAFREDIQADILARGLVELLRMPLNQTLFPRDQFEFRQVNQEFLKAFVLGILTPQEQQRWGSEGLFQI